MQLKFSVFGPAIGGAKSGIIMDPDDPNKDAVLKRWFEFIKPILQSSYGTAADLNTDFQKIQLLLNNIGIPHPQYGIIQSVCDTPKKISDVINRMMLLDKKIKLGNKVPVSVAQMATGYLIAQLAKNTYDKRGQEMLGQNVVVQGVGTVGSAAAYYLNQMGAKVVGLVDHDGGVIDQHGFSDKILTDLLATLSIKKTFAKVLSHQDFYQLLTTNHIDLFIPAAGSYLVNDKIADVLIQQQCQLIISGANIPFENNSIEHKLSTHMEIIPAFIASGGMACAFSALLQTEIKITKPQDILNLMTNKIAFLHR
jgi:glutamate dehydrogenase/leucine dehydrogenase